MFSQMPLAGSLASWEWVAQPSFVLMETEVFSWQQQSIKCPQEASEWLGGNISYARAAGIAPGWFCSLELLEKQTSSLQEDACIVDVKMTAALEILTCLQHTQAQACEGLKSRQPNLYEHITNLWVFFFLFDFPDWNFWPSLGWMFFNKYTKHLKKKNLLEFTGHEQVFWDFPFWLPQ